MSKLYPLKFKPILKERIWGGDKLKTELGKELFSDQTGESWELSSVKGEVSEVCNGELKGKNLNQLIEEFKGELVGYKIYKEFGNDFPLLFKFIDAKDDLSIQLHPNDELALRRHQSFGKTEMWYVMHADEGARIIMGFKNPSTQEEYLKHLNEKSLVSILKEIPVKRGDVFFLETGTIHAIGKGILIAEIQQTSDVTYRLYDWDRVDNKGIGRELHTELALEAINYAAVGKKMNYKTEENQMVHLVECPYFKTQIIDLNSQNFKWTQPNDSFTVLMCTEGEVEIKMNHEVLNLIKGETVLIPACINSFDLNGKAKILEISL